MKTLATISTLVGLTLSATAVNADRDPFYDYARVV